MVERCVGNLTLAVEHDAGRNQSYVGHGADSGDLLLDGYFSPTVMVRAVIEALMEPTRPMRDAGTAVFTDPELGDELPLSIDVFRAMIHAALKETINDQLG